MSTPIYLEQRESKKFVELMQHDNCLRIRRGSVGKPCLVYRLSWTRPGKAIEQCARLRAEWTQQGFAEQAPSLIIDGSIADQAWCNDELAEHPEYGEFFDLGWASDLLGSKQRLLIFKNGLHVDDDFDLEEIADMGICSGLIIDGNLQVNGVLSQLSYTYPGSTLVLGDVIAHSMAHKDSFLRIKGDARITNIIYGEYNDGSLQIEGDAYGAAWICSDHDMSARHYHLPVFSSHGDDQDWQNLSPKILGLDGSLDEASIREFIYAGKSPLRRGYQWQPPARSAPEVVAPTEPSQLLKSLRGFAVADDVEGMTALLENWPERNTEWLEVVQMRIRLPSSNDDQRQRLQRVLARQLAGPQVAEPEAVVQVEGFAQADPAIQRLIEAMRGKAGAARVLKMLENPPEPALFPAHSHVLLVNVLLKNKDFPPHYLPLIERLYALGVDPLLSDADGRIIADDSLVRSQPEVVSLLQRILPAGALWLPPETGQVTNHLQAHRKIAALLDVINAPADQAPWVTLNSTIASIPKERFDSHPLKDLLPAHNWILLSNLVRRCAEGHDEFIQSIVDLLHLGLDPNISFDGMEVGVVELAKQLGQQDVLAVFAQFFPPEDPEKPQDGAEVFAKLLALEAAGADFSAPEHQRWLMQLRHVRQVFGKLPQLPRSVVYATALQSLLLAWPEYDSFALPDLSGLSKLKALALVDMKLTTIPDWIASLNKLEDLSLGYNPIVEIPLWLAALPSLHTLSLSGTQIGLGAHALGEFSKLRCLVLADLKLPQFPDWLAKLTQLQELNLTSNPITEIPTWLSHFSSLQTLVLAHTQIRAIDAIAPLKGIRELYLQNCDLAVLPEWLLEFPKLKVLMLGKTMHKLFQQQPELINALVQKGVAMDDLPDATSLDSEPPSKRSTKRRGSITALKQVKKLNQQAQQVQVDYTQMPQQRNLALLSQTAERAYQLFAQAIEKAQTDVDLNDEDFAYDYCYSLQGKLWCVNELVGHANDPAHRQWNPSVAISLAHQILQLADGTFRMYYANEGEIQRAASVLAHNTLAWYHLQAGELPHALIHADAAFAEIDYAQGTETYGRVLENKVRIQLAMGDADAAFATTYQLLRAHPIDETSEHDQHVFQYFYALQSSAAFRQWDAEN